MCILCILHTSEKQLSLSEQLFQDQKEGSWKGTATSALFFMLYYIFFQPAVLQFANVEIVSTSLCKTAHNSFDVGVSIRICTLNKEENSVCP